MKGIEMTAYDELRSGEARYFGEALIAADAFGRFEEYARSQGCAEVWEAMLPYAEERYVGVISRAAAVFAAA